MKRLVVCLLVAGCAEENRTELPPYEEPTPSPAACRPNLDGRIDATEATPALGIPISFRVSPAGSTRTVDLLGEADESGALTWDWSVDAAGDQAVARMAEPLAGKWYASSFPAAGAFVADLDAAGSLEAVYTHDAAGLHLHGYASREPAPAEGRTLMVYGSAVDVLRFPIEPGLSFSDSATISNGEFKGIPFAGTDTYQVDVDAIGRIVLPDLTLAQVHRVRTHVTVQPLYGFANTQRQTIWLFECFGEVARATSATNEPDEDFTQAVEVRRLSL